MEITASSSNFKNHSRADHVGIYASILCAIHCAATPALLIALPTFGKAWAHPATHWGMAIIVIPIAFFMLRKGFKEHAKKWILVTGVLGILLIIIGAILPYTESNPLTIEQAPPVRTSETSAQAQSGCSSCAASSDCSTETVNTENATCVDNCCPSFVTNSQGEQSLHIPPASIVTTLGGLCLIAVHAGNLCFCAQCRRKKKRACIQSNELT